MDQPSLLKLIVTGVLLDTIFSAVMLACKYCRTWKQAISGFLTIILIYSGFIAFFHNHGSFSQQLYEIPIPGRPVFHALYFMMSVFAGLLVKLLLKKKTTAGP